MSEQNEIDKHIFDFINEEISSSKLFELVNPHDCVAAMALEIKRLLDRDLEVCEWKKSETAFIYYSSCHEGIVVASNDFTYCPYCSKKIKSV